MPQDQRPSQKTLREKIGKRGAPQFKYFNSFTEAEFNSVAVLICDELHRIREPSNIRFTRKERQSNLKQIEELLNVSKVAVFFIDDDQVVRPNEVGSVDYIKDYAQKNNCNILEYELDIQFRCGGSEAFKSREAESCRLAKELDICVKGLAENWSSMRFLGTSVYRDGENWKFEVQVYFGEVDPGMVKVELYADPMDDEGPMKVAMTREGAIPGVVNGYLYRARLPATLPADHYTPRIASLSSSSSRTFRRESHLMGALDCLE